MRTCSDLAGRTDTDASVRRAVLAVARRRQATLDGVAPEDHLVHDLGCDSLDLAQIVALLEVELGVDPFRTVTLGALRTVEDLCAIYRGAHVGRR